MKIDSSKIRIADLRYYEENKGIELSDSLSKVILVDYSGDGSYFNPFSLEEEYPIFKRAPISNVRNDGISYGTKMYYVGNELVTGPCWVLTNVDFGEVSGISSVSMSDLEDYILTSPEFFKDRVLIASNRLGISRQANKMKKIIDNDIGNIEKMYNFFEERKTGRQKVKED